MTPAARPCLPCRRIAGRSRSPGRGDCPARPRASSAPSPAAAGRGPARRVPLRVAFVGKLEHARQRTLIRRMARPSTQAWASASGVLVMCMRCGREENCVITSPGTQQSLGPCWWVLGALSIMAASIVSVAHLLRLRRRRTSRSGRRPCASTSRVSAWPIAMWVVPAAPCLDRCQCPRLHLAGGSMLIWRTRRSRPARL